MQLLTWEISLSNTPHPPWNFLGYGYFLELHILHYFSSFIYDELNFCAMCPLLTFSVVF